MASHTFVETQNATLHCTTEGPGGQAPWVVFSNSLVTDLSIWDVQAAALSERFNILRYDQRGHGKSSVSDTPLTFDSLGDDVLALLDHFGIETCTFVGLSMGVPTGLRAFDRAPERFTRLVFVDGMARTAPTGAAAWQERIDMVADQGMEAFATATAARWLQDDTLNSDKGRALTAMIAATPQAGFVQCVRALQGYDYWNVLARINVPLLAVAGARDGAIPDAMAKAFGAVPGAQIETIAKAGHVPNYERPEAFNAVLTAFLQAGL